MDPVTLFITTLGAAAGKAAATEASKLIRELIGLQEAQIALLQRIDVKVDALQGGPFNTGRRQLVDAMAADRQPTDRTEFLKAARTSFTQALAQETEPARRSLAGIHLAAVWLTLDSPNDAKRSLREAHLEALQAIAGVLEISGSKLKRVLEDSRLVVGELLAGPTAAMAKMTAPPGSWPDRLLGPPRKTRKRTIERIAFANAISTARRNSGAAPNDAPLVDMDAGLDIDPAMVRLAWLRMSRSGLPDPSALKANEVPYWLWQVGGLAK